MTRKELRKTAWAKRFKKETESYVYDEAISFAMRPKLEVLIYKDVIEIDVPDEEPTVQAKPFWVISVQKTKSRSDDNFWMDAFKTKKEAVALCKEMGWKVVK